MLLSRGMDIRKLSYVEALRSAPNHTPLTPFPYREGKPVRETGRRPHLVPVSGESLDISHPYGRRVTLAR
jgi:hypothetical protein